MVKYIMSVETILHIRMIAHDDEITETDADDLAEFIIDTLNQEFRKDCLEFQKVNTNK